MSNKTQTFLGALPFVLLLIAVVGLLSSGSSLDIVQRIKLILSENLFLLMVIISILLIARARK